MAILLERETIKKLTSDKGILEVLCDIDNLDIDNLEELPEEKRDLIDYTLGLDLISNSQIEANIRRSLDNQNLALLNKKQLLALSLLYFGKKDDQDRYIEYVCPYTGQKYNLIELRKELRKNYKDRDKAKVLELEHIQPHSSKGGTVLFNCIPISKRANIQKNDAHLLDFFDTNGGEYFEKEGVERLHNLVNYIISAYDIAFTSYEETDLDFEYEYENQDEGLDDEDLENEITLIKEKAKRQKKTPIEGYLPYLNQLITRLQKEGVDITKIIERLNELQKDGIIQNTSKYEVAQQTIENIFNNLTYSSYVDYVKLVESIKPSTLENIKSTIIKRISNIKALIISKGKTMEDYFTSMRDMVEQDILYKDVDIEDKNNKDIIAFVANIRLGHKGKINLFIEMLTEKQYTSYEEGKVNESNIFSSLNKISFKGYESIEGLNTVHFWSVNRDKIIKRLNYLEINSKNVEEKEKYKIARRSIEEYEFITNLEKRIDTFLDMLTDKQYTSYEEGKANESNIFNQKNRIPFKGYENIEGLNIATFWNNNSLEIIKRLNYLEINSKNVEEKEKYKIARRSIEEYEFITNLEKRIDTFLDMLTDKQYISYEEGKAKENNIFNKKNEIPFKGYESIKGLNTALFWRNNSPKILERLNYLEINSKSIEEKEKYKTARRSIEEYEFITNLEKRIDTFMEMLLDKQYTSYESGKANESNIFNSRNKIPFKGYESIEGLNTANFWSHNSTKIKERLNYLEINSQSAEAKEKYKIARRSIEEYEFITNLEKRIDTFLEMLIDKQYTSYEEGKANESNIFNQKNRIPFKGYESIEGLNIATFWKDNSLEIIKRLNCLEINSKNVEAKEKYKIVRRSIEEYEFITNLEKRIDTFLEMLTDKQYTSYEDGKANESNIFNRRNRIPFKGYESIEGLNTARFWGDNSPEIIKRLNYLENNSKSNEVRVKYKIARRSIEEYEFITNPGKRIDVFIEMLSEDKYTCYNGKRPNENNIFNSLNKIPFKGYESTEGLNTASFWNTNSQKYIIPLLFYNKYYDSKEKKYIDSHKNYSGPEYDKARQNILEYLKVNTIDEYINKLKEKDKKTKKIQNLIDLRDNLKNKNLRLRQYEQQLINENIELKESINNTTRRAM